MSGARNNLIRCLALVFLAMIVAMSVGGCEGSDDTASNDEGTAAPRISNDELSAAFALAESYHEQATIASEAGELKEAASAMSTLIVELEKIGTTNYEVETLLMDGYGRRGKIEIELGLFTEALASADAGLKGRSDRANRSLFAGYLHQVRGNALKNLDRPREAVDAHKTAIVLFQAILDAHR